MPKVLAQNNHHHHTTGNNNNNNNNSSGNFMKHSSTNNNMNSNNMMNADSANLFLSAAPNGSSTSSSTSPSLLGVPTGEPGRTLRRGEPLKFFNAHKTDRIAFRKRDSAFMTNAKPLRGGLAQVFVMYSDFFPELIGQTLQTCRQIILNSKYVVVLRSCAGTCGANAAANGNNNNNIIIHHHNSSSPPPPASSSSVVGGGATATATAATTSTTTTTVPNSSSGTSNAHPGMILAPHKHRDEVVYEGEGFNLPRSVLDNPATIIRTLELCLVKRNRKDRRKNLLPAEEQLLNTIDPLMARFERFSNSLIKDAISLDNLATPQQLSEAIAGLSLQPWSFAINDPSCGRIIYTYNSQAGVFIRQYPDVHPVPLPLVTSPRRMHVKLGDRPGISELVAYLKVISDKISSPHLARFVQNPAMLYTIQ